MDGRPLYLRVADLVARLGADHVGEYGYSDVGAVAGATSPTSLRLVREALPHAFLLVPGYGAQGAGADALRGIAAGARPASWSTPRAPSSTPGRTDGEDYHRAAAGAAESMRNDLAAIL